MADKHTHDHSDHNHDHAGHDHSHDHTDPNSLLAPNTKFEVTIPWSDAQPAWNKALNKLAKRVKTSGFRAGKVPPAIAAQMIGHERIMEEAVQTLLPPVYQKAIEDKKLKPLTSPDVKPLSTNQGEDWKFEFAIAEKPKVEIKGYEKLAKEGLKVAEKELKEEEKAKKESKDKAATPAPERTEEDLKEYKLRYIFRELVTGLKPRIPELLLKEETRAELERLVRSLNQLKVTLDDYLARRQMSFDQLSTEVATQVLTRIQLDYVLEAIGEHNAFKSEEKDRQVYIDRIENKEDREKYQKDPAYIQYLDTVVVRQKVLDHLVAV